MAFWTRRPREQVAERRHVSARGHLEQLGGDYVSVSSSCVDDLEIDETGVVYWDGRHEHWRAGPRRTPWPVPVA